MMTSGTTILVLMSLVLFGGSSIFSFSLIMTIGVIVGTFSTLHRLTSDAMGTQKGRRTQSQAARCKAVVEKKIKNQNKKLC